MGFEVGLKQLDQQCGVADVNIEERIQNMQSVYYSWMYHNYMIWHMQKTSYQLLFWQLPKFLMISVLKNDVDIC